MGGRSLEPRRRATRILVGHRDQAIPLGRVRFALLLSPLSIQSEAFLCAAVPRLSNEVWAEGGEWQPNCSWRLGISHIRRLLFMKLRPAVAPITSGRRPIGTPKPPIDVRHYTAR